MSDLSFKFKGEEYKPTTRVNTYIFDYPCPEKNECFPIETTFPPGQYMLEVWGAQGGSFPSYPGGKGGYSRGFLTIKNAVKAFLYIGAEGTITPGKSMFSNFSFNGGGFGYGSANYPVSSGGGGTDIRIESDSIYNRVIVSGGGGGSSKAYDTCIGGAGGGENGIEGEKCNYKASNASAGTQTSGNFWSGGNRTSGDGCGGGGGFFGGNAGIGYESSGGGGSGFIFNSTNYQNALKAQMKLLPRYFLKYGITLNGLSEFPSPKSNQTETGHEGDGSIRITYFRGYLCQTIKIKNRYIRYTSLIISLIYS